MSPENTFEFNVGFNACVIASYLEHTSMVEVAEKVAAAAIGIAKAEKDGVVWGEEGQFDVVCENVARIIQPRGAFVAPTLTLSGLELVAYSITAVETHSKFGSDGKVIRMET